MICPAGVLSGGFCPGEDLSGGFCPGWRFCPFFFVLGFVFVGFVVQFFVEVWSGFSLSEGCFLRGGEGVVPGPFSAKSATSAELVVRVRGLGRGVARNRAELSPACVGLPQPIRICLIG